jgi:hypothetical protein
MEADILTGTAAIEKEIHARHILSLYCCKDPMRSRSMGYDLSSLQSRKSKAMTRERHRIRVVETQSVVVDWYPTGQSEPPSRPGDVSRARARTRPSERFNALLLNHGDHRLSDQKTFLFDVLWAWLQRGETDESHA